MFCGPSNNYILRNGKVSKGDWDLVGTENQDKVKIQDYMTYDEIKMAAFLQISSPVSPINSGSRQNGARGAFINHVVNQGWKEVQKDIQNCKTEPKSRYLVCKKVSKHSF